MKKILLLNFFRKMLIDSRSKIGGIKPSFQMSRYDEITFFLSGIVAPWVFAFVWGFL